MAVVCVLCLNGYVSEHTPKIRNMPSISNVVAQGSPTSSHDDPRYQLSLVTGSQQATTPKATPIMDTGVGQAPLDMNKWLYQDPQGETQGPFTSSDMNKWYQAGYFTMDLMVQRACDLILLPLGKREF